MTDPEPERRPQTFVQARHTTASATVQRCNKDWPPCSVSLVYRSPLQRSTPRCTQLKGYYDPLTRNALHFKNWRSAEKFLFLLFCTFFSRKLLPAVRPRCVPNLRQMHCNCFKPFEMYHSAKVQALLFATLDRAWIRKKVKCRSSFSACTAFALLCIWSDQKIMYAWKWSELSFFAKMPVCVFILNKGCCCCSSSFCLPSFLHQDEDATRQSGPV